MSSCAVAFPMPIVLSPPQSPIFSESYSSPSPSSSLPLLFVDWDDTLLCSSYLQSTGVPLDASYGDIPLALENALQLLETQVVALLTNAFSLGFRVVIVTNAEQDWVQHSTQRFLPAVSPLLQYLQIVSARAEFEKQFPDAPQQWKIHVFQSKIQEFFPSTCSSSSSSPKNILSLGDSLFEREAIHTATRVFTNVYTKSVKFVEHPSPEQLRRQLELVAKSLSTLCEHQGDLDLMLTIAVAGSTDKPSTPPSPRTPPATPPLPPPLAAPAAGSA